MLLHFECMRLVYTQVTINTAYSKKRFLDVSYRLEHSFYIYQKHII